MGVNILNEIYHDTKERIFRENSKMFFPDHVKSTFNIFNKFIEFVEKKSRNYFAS